MRRDAEILYLNASNLLVGLPISIALRMAVWALLGKGVFRLGRGNFPTLAEGLNETEVITKSGNKPIVDQGIKAA